MALAVGSSLCPLLVEHGCTSSSRVAPKPWTAACAVSAESPRRPPRLPAHLTSRKRWRVDPAVRLEPAAVRLSRTVALGLARPAVVLLPLGFSRSLNRGQPFDLQRDSEGPCPLRTGWRFVFRLSSSCRRLPCRHVAGCVRSSPRRETRRCSAACNRPSEPTAPVSLKARVRHAFRSTRPSQRRAGYAASLSCCCVAS